MNGMLIFILNPKDICYFIIKHNIDRDGLWFMDHTILIYFQTKNIWYLWKHHNNIIYKHKADAINSATHN